MPPRPPLSGQASARQASGRRAVPVQASVRRRPRVLPPPRRSQSRCRQRDPPRFLHRPPLLRLQTRARLRPCPREGPAGRRLCLPRPRRRLLPHRRRFLPPRRRRLPRPKRPLPPFRLRLMRRIPPARLRDRASVSGNPARHRLRDSRRPVAALLSAHRVRRQYSAHCRARRGIH